MAVIICDKDGHQRRRIRKNALPPRKRPPVGCVDRRCRDGSRSAKIVALGGDSQECSPESKLTIVNWRQQGLSRFQSRTGLKRELAIWHKARMRPQLLLVSTHPASTLALRAIHSSRSRINGSTDKARCAGIHVASRPSNDMVRTTPANTIGSRGLAS
jgi:hypothetical protein